VNADKIPGRSKGSGTSDEGREDNELRVFDIGRETIHLGKQCRRQKTRLTPVVLLDEAVTLAALGDSGLLTSHESSFGL
jgi:hypothetical protein